MYSYHPPDVVTLSRSGTGLNTPETESPLSSAPNSPRSSHGMFESSANFLEELLQQEREEREREHERERERAEQATQQQQQQLLQQELEKHQYEEEQKQEHLLQSEAPFDEIVDEKKQDGDELMGHWTDSRFQHQHHNDLYSDDQDDGDEEEEEDCEPPSLAVHRTPARPPDVPKEDDQPITEAMTPLQELQSPPPLIKQTTLPWETVMVSPETAIREEDAPMDESQEIQNTVDICSTKKESPILEAEPKEEDEVVLVAERAVETEENCSDEDDDNEGDFDSFDIPESTEYFGERPAMLSERAVTGETSALEPPNRPSMKDYRSNSEPVIKDWNKYLKNYREMTPKKDLKTSERSSAWLQEEFIRRSTIKQEINKAILARNLNQDLENISAVPDTLDIPDSPDSPKEYLAVVTDSEGGIPPPDDEFAAALSRALEAIPPSSSPDSKADLSQHSEDDEVAALTTSMTTAIVSDEGGPLPRRLDFGYQQDMQRFADGTRAALRESETGFRSLADESPPPVESQMSGLSGTSNLTEDSDIDITVKPILVHSMDSYLGIAKGDITLSLLNESTPIPQKATWANRVQGAIWRCRRMRRNMGGIPVFSTTTTRSSLPVDMDKARVADSIRNIKTTQEAALRHLQQDEIEEAMDLFEDIIFAYYAYFERTLQEREAHPGVKVDGNTDFRPYIGVALHNLGILNLLKGQYREALSYFGRALDHRKASLGEGHPDHVASLVKYATCMYAVNEFADAHAKLEQALVYARQNCQDLGDRMQMAEILNNLGCLAYMCGQPVAANTFFSESLDVQFTVLTHSLYLSSAAVGQSISLNISIIRANIGFIKLVTKDIPRAITALENALMEQQLLLLGANDTLIATMDHLALANLLNGDSQKATMMFDRVLELQQKEYGPNDRRCYVTIDKINIVKSRGTNFEQAIEELRKTFCIPDEDMKEHTPTKSGKRTPNRPTHEQTFQKTKNQKSKVMQVFTSIRKKKPLNF